MDPATDYDTDDFDTTCQRCDGKVAPLSEQRIMDIFEGLRIEKLESQGTTELNLVVFARAIEREHGIAP